MPSPNYTVSRCLKRHGAYPLRSRDSLGKVAATNSSKTLCAKRLAVRLCFYMTVCAYVLSIALAGLAVIVEVTEFYIVGRGVRLRCLPCEVSGALVRRIQGAQLGYSTHTLSAFTALHFA